MWFRRAAEAGTSRLRRGRSGCCYLTGAGLPRDPTEAARWFRQSRPRPAIRWPSQDLANLVLQGKAASPAIPIRIREWFEQAATAGDLVAAYNYGICLAEGVGVDRDDAQAAHWLRRAAEGVVNAQYWYGRMLIEGRGVACRPGGAVGAWIAKRRHARACWMRMVALAEMLRERPRRRARPRRRRCCCFKRAAENGHVGAMFALGAMLWRWP